MYKLFDKRIKLYVTKLLQLSNINMLSIINSNKCKYILCDFIRIKTRSISFASVRFNTIISIYRLSITFRYYQYLYYIFFFDNFTDNYISTPSFLLFFFISFHIYLFSFSFNSSLLSLFIDVIPYILCYLSFIAILFHMKLGQTVKLAKRFKFSMGPLFYF